jgi:hypothetical protein
MAGERTSLNALFSELCMANLQIYWGTYNLSFSEYKVQMLKKRLKK